MPWVSIISAIITFFLSKSSGKSTAAAALTAGAVGLGTYYLADPSNPDNLFKIGVDSSKTAPAGAEGAQIVVPSSTVGSTLSSAYGQTVDAAGKVLTSWGPTGTAAVIGTTALATNSDLTKYVPWILGAAALWILFK